MTPILEIDHIVVSCSDLQEGTDYVEDVLGVKMAPGGKHASMGTHNTLLRLGDVYLEVIAIDPDAPPPGRMRWFDLDNFSGAPRLTNWVAKVRPFDEALQIAPRGIGRPMHLSRGDLSWVVAISDDGKLPFDGGFPGFIDWGDGVHPTQQLPDAGCRLSSWQIAHPDADGLGAALGSFDHETRIGVSHGANLSFAAAIETPEGLKVLT